MSQIKNTPEEKKDNVVHITKNNAGEAAIQHGTPIWYIKAKNVIYYILGLLEVLLGLRFLFMLLGANPRSGFTSFIYAITGIFIAPFSGIFSPFSTTGLASRSVLDPATLIAMAIYALIAWGIVRLLWIKVSREA
ncbi:MAG: YggT family protein [Clostridiaceae bacterium]|jgi:hypothetical protein|nr:YggT family protein [Clostridiaceae bacterium]